MRSLSLFLIVGLIAVLLVPGIAIAKAEKVDICHATGNGSFRLISVSANAVPAHLAHGDGLPGGPVPGMVGFEFDDECNAVEVLQTTTVTSAVLDFSSTGAGGQSCPPEYPQVLDAYLQDVGTDGDPTVAAHTLYLWVPGATTGTVTYPYTPFGYTYGTWYPGETGAIVLNGITPQSAQIVLTCQEAP